MFRPFLPSPVFTTVADRSHRPWLRVVAIVVSGLVSFGLAFVAARVPSGPAELAPGAGAAEAPVGLPESATRSELAGSPAAPVRSGSSVRYEVRMSVPGEPEAGAVQELEIVNVGQMRSSRVSTFGQVTTEVLASPTEVWIRTVPWEAPEGEGRLSGWYHDQLDPQRWSDFTAQDDELRAAVDGAVEVGDRFWEMTVHEVERVGSDHVRLLLGDRDGVVVDVVRSDAAGIELSPPSRYLPMSDFPDATG